MKYIPRLAAARLKRLLREFPAVLLVGPRQSGKSTLAHHVTPGWARVDLERPAERAGVAADVEAYLAGHPRRLVIDEAQRLPELFPALRYVIDQDRTPGRYLLLGSAAPALIRSVSETLAGRIGMLELTPFLPSEVAGRSLAEARWFWGGLPPVLEMRGPGARADWLDAYVATFLERDLPAMGVQLPAQRLRTLWTMLTHVHGNLLNVSDLARSLSVSYHTVADYLDVLESAFMIRRLPPYFANVQKRLTKSPKLYIRDTGLLHFLAGLRVPRELTTWPRRGASFEGMVIEELAAQAAAAGVRPGVYFWRTQAGGEVDLLVQLGRKLIAVEIKLGTVVGRYEVAGLRQCMKDLRLRHGWVITAGGKRSRLGRDIDVVPWADVANRRVDLGIS